MVSPGFVIFVPYTNQRFAEVRIMLFDRRDRCVPVWPTPTFSRGIGLVLNLFLDCGFWGFFLCTCRYLQKMFFTSCVTIKSRHILRLIIHTVNYQFKAAVVVPDSTSPGFV